MSKWKSLLAALVAILLLATAAGCSGTPGGTPAATAATSGGSTAPGQYAEHVKISWVPQNDHEVPQNANTKVALEEMFNWTIDAIYLDRNNETQLLNTRLAAGEIPDVIRVGNDTRYRELAAQGVLKGLDAAVIAQHAPTMNQAMLDLFAPVTDNIWDFISIDGTLYGFPIGNLNSTYAEIPIWRDDWLEKVGIKEVPYKWDDAVKAFRAFTHDDPDGDGQNNTYAMSNTGMNALRSSAFGGNAFDFTRNGPDGKLAPNILLPEYKMFVEAMAEFYKEGLIDPEFITGENQGQYWAKSVTFINGLIGFSKPGAYYHTNGPLYEGQTNPSTNHDPFYELNPNGSYTHGTSVEGPTGMRYAWVGGANPGGKVVIGKNISDAAYIRFLEFHEAMFSDYDVYRLVVDGVKGIAWDDLTLPDGRIANKVATQEEVDAAGHPEAKKGNYTNGFGFLAEDCWDFLKRRDVALYDYADKVATPAALGGEYITNKIWAGVTKTTTQKTDMDTLHTQNFQQFVTGQRPLSEWDAFIKELEAAGLQAWMEECLAWYYGE